MKTLATLLLSLLCCLSAQAQLKFIWMTKALVPGESTQLFLMQENGQPFSLDALPKINNGSLKLEQSGTIAWKNSPGGRAFAVLFTCIPDKPGAMTIPSFEVKDQAGKMLVSQPQSVAVVPFDRIQWKETSYRGETYPYGVFWYVPQASPYVNQPLECELKIYSPDSLNNFNVPQIQSEGLAVGTFLPPLFYQSITPSGEALLKGRNWIAYSYSGNVTPLKSGNVRLGPGSLDATVMDEQVDSRWGQIIRQLVPIPLTLPDYVIEAKALPSSAPAGFQNAVGSFSLSASTKTTDLTEGEPVSVTIRLKGKGNLNIISCPLPEQEENWKLYPANKITPADDQSGTLEFQQLMKPLKEVSGIPSFKLVYFDPEKGRYETARSEPIPLKWKASSEHASGTGAKQAQPPAAGSVPVEEMTDIISTTKAPSSLRLSLSILAAHDLVLWPWALVPALVLIFLGIYKRAKERQNQTADKRERLHRLEGITPGADARSFLRSLGAYVEAEIPENRRTEEIKLILSERDSSSYLPENQIIDLPMERKTAMLHAVKKAVRLLPVLLLSLMTMLAVSPLSAAEASARAHYGTGDYKEAREALVKERESISGGAELANHFYLLGNTEYKLGNPGQAALAYRRALLIAPDLYEATRNLAFIERKEGAIHKTLTSTEEILAKVPYMCFKYTTLLFLLLFTTTAAGMWAWRRKGVSQWFLFGLFLLGLATSGWCLWKYPVIPSSLDASEQFIITAPGSAAWHDATKDSKKVFTKLPPGSVAQVLAARGSWLYVEFANGIRGWVPEDAGSFLLEKPAQLDNA